MRSVLLLGVLVIAGCETMPPEQSRAETALQQHCDAGNADACLAMVQAEEAKRRRQLAASAVLLGYGAALQQQPAYQQPTFQTTSCRPVGGAISCTTF